MRTLLPTVSYWEQQTQLQKERDEKNARRRKIYDEKKEHRQEQLRKRRKERVEWLKEYLAIQPCNECGQYHRRIAWHHKDPSLDYEDQDRNLSHARELAQQGYSYARLHAALNDLVPLCPECLPKVRPTFADNPILTKRQIYERTRYDALATKRGEYMKNRRKYRKDWLAEQMDRPCAQCGATEDIEWHKSDISLDNPVASENMYTLTSMVNNGAKIERMEAELSTMFPTCPSCYTKWRMGYEELAREEQRRASHERRRF